MGGVLPFCWVVFLLSWSRLLALLCRRAPCLPFFLPAVFSSAAVLFLVLLLTLATVFFVFATCFLGSLPRLVLLVTVATFLGALKLRSHRASRARKARKFCLELTSPFSGANDGLHLSFEPPKNSRFGSHSSCRGDEFSRRVEAFISPPQ